MPIKIDRRDFNQIVNSLDEKFRNLKLVDEIESYRNDFYYSESLLLETCLISKADRYGNITVEDCKGFKTPEYKIKKKLMLFKYHIKIKET